MARPVAAASPAARTPASTRRDQPRLLAARVRGTLLAGLASPVLGCRQRRRHGRRSLASRHDELKLDLLHESACGAPRKEEVPARADSRSFISFAATRRQTSLPRLLLSPFSSKAPGSGSARRARGGWRTRGKATLRGQIGRQLRSYLVLAF
nr:unnamed protein product [Digitaria exilis]